MITDAPLWLAATGVLLVLLTFVLVGGALLLCRYDQRHERDSDLNVTLGQRNLRYRSRTHDPAEAATSSEHENVRPFPTKHSTPTEQYSSSASQDTPPAAETDHRKAA